MKSLVYIDACMRKDSSTRRIAKPIISGNPQLDRVD